MKERISAVMDGEHDAQEFAHALADLRDPGEAQDTWNTYHLISDALRDTRLTSRGFAARVCARLEGEPTVLAPRTEDRAAPAASPERTRWFALSAVASLAAVAFVGTIALMPPPGAEQAPVAQAPARQAVAPVAASGAKSPASVPLTNAANDYLLAHQAYSPRNSFQGVAPYVRTVTVRGVAERTGERRR